MRIKTFINNISIIMTTINIYKVCIIGSSAVGKTHFSNKLMDRFHLGPLTTTYDPTIGIEVNPITFRTNIGWVKINLWEISGSHRPIDTPNYYVGTHAVIVLSTPLTLIDSQQWLQEAINFAPNARKFHCHNINGNIVAANTDKEPMTGILRKLTNKPNLVIL